MDGTGYLDYPVEVYGVSITFTRYNKSDVFGTERHQHQSIFGNLISFGGVDTSTILPYPRVIDGRNGATGSASVTRLNTDVYDAAYIISSRSLCRIIWGANNYQKMVAVPNTIHAEERS